MLAQAQEPKSHRINVEGTKILIIEDEALFARAVAKRLQKAGFECEHAETLTDGLKLAKQFQPDFVLLDMRLPDGYAVEGLRGH